MPRTWLQREMAKPDVPGKMSALSRCKKCRKMVKEYTKTPYCDVKGCPNK